MRDGKPKDLLLLFFDTLLGNWHKSHVLFCVVTLPQNLTQISLSNIKNRQ